MQFRRCKISVVEVFSTSTARLSIPRKKATLDQ